VVLNPAQLEVSLSGIPTAAVVADIHYVLTKAIVTTLIRGLVVMFVMAFQIVTMAPMKPVVVVMTTNSPAITLTVFGIPGHAMAGTTAAITPMKLVVGAHNVGAVSSAAITVTVFGIPGNAMAGTTAAITPMKLIANCGGSGDSPAQDINASLTFST
jgi:hypothetical protein